MDGRTQLKQHLEGHGAQAALARSLECSEPHLSLIISGGRNASPRLAKRLEKATGIPAGQFCPDLAEIQSTEAAQ